VKAKSKKPPREYARDRTHRIMVRFNDKEVQELKRLGRIFRSQSQAQTLRLAMRALSATTIKLQVFVPGTTGPARIDGRETWVELPPKTRGRATGDPGASKGDS
jgi:poly(A) polymerase Pap1